MSPVVLVAVPAAMVVIGLALVAGGERVRVLHKLQAMNRGARARLAPPEWGRRDVGGAPQSCVVDTAHPHPNGTGRTDEQVASGISVALPVGGTAWGPPPTMDDALETVPSTDPAESANSTLERFTETPQPVVPAPGPTVEPARLDAPVSRPPSPPGWYPDPRRVGEVTFWNGVEWTNHSQPLQDSAE